MGSRIDMWGHILFFREAGWQVVVAVCLTPEMLATRSLDVVLPLDIELHVLRLKARWSDEEEPETVGQVQSLIEQCRPSIIWCEYADFAPLSSALNLNGAKLWFRPHNFEVAHAIEKAIEPRPWRSWNGYRGMKQAFWWVKGQFHYIRKIISAERLMHRIADRLFFISYKDMSVMTKIFGGREKSDWVLPFLDRDQIPIKEEKSLLDVVFLGSDFSNNVNMAGVRSLLHEVIPAVETAMPSTFRFHIVGRGSKDLMDVEALSNTVLHDYIDDLQLFLKDMDIACLPVKLGWGCKIKMIESLACGLPLAGAPETFRGIPEVEGAYYSCRKTGDYIAAFRALRNAEERRRMSNVSRDVYTTWLEECRRNLNTALSGCT